MGWSFGWSVAAVLCTSLLCHISVNARPNRHLLQQEEILTEGGNGEGAACVFPFVYNEKQYTECTEDGHTKLWCAVTADFPTDERWGNCIIVPETTAAMPTTEGLGTTEGAETTAAMTTEGDTEATEFDGILTEGGNANGAPCVFPFTYKEQEYTECTDKGHTRLWCATTDSYDDDKTWGNCIIVTTVMMTTGEDETEAMTTMGMTTESEATEFDGILTEGGNADGAPCVFPFMYKETEYTECTDKGHTRPWCATTDNYDEDKTWGNCILESDTTLMMTTEEEETTEGMTTEGMTTMAVTEEPIFTFGGNADGAPCVFPFTFREVVYEECTMERHVKLWCATTDNFDEDEKWGNCIIPTEGPETTGPAETTVEATTEGAETTMGATTEGMTTMAETMVTTEEDIDPIFTFGGNANGEACVFPFIYKEQEYTECTEDGHTKLWCGVTANFDEDKQWGNCILPTEGPTEEAATTVMETVMTTIGYPEIFTTGGTALNGTKCVFPFTYKEQEYTECTIDGHVKLWCAAVADYDSDTNNIWGNCVIPDSTVAPTEAETTEGLDTTMAATTEGDIMTTISYPIIFTEGGKVADDTRCVFPFIYNGKEYVDCTMDGHVKLWCAVISDLADDPDQWGNCKIEI